MGILSRNLKEDVTHWTVASDAFGGYTFGTPAALKGRWEQKSVQFRLPTGEEVTSDAVVYLNGDVDVEDYIFLGESEVADPTTIKAFQVRQFHKTPDLRNLESLREAFL